ncbi:MAG: alpha/beta hydrolase [Pseudomonadota bacterium]
MFHRCLGVIALLLLAGCSSFDVLNGVTGSGHYEVIADITYADHGRGQLDIYLPTTAAVAPPVLVFFYGGSWREGSRQDYEFVASELTRAGIIVVLPDYRRYPAVQFPTFVEDAADSVRFARAELGSRQIAHGDVYVGGHSAGAHIAALLALSPDFLGDERASLAGFVGLSGPYDFLPLESSFLKSVFPASSRAESQPIAFAKNGAGRVLLIHGGADKTVAPGNSERLADALARSDAAVSLKIYPGVKHARVVAALATPLSRLAPTAKDIAAFLIEPESARPSLDAPAQ